MEDLEIKVRPYKQTEISTLSSLSIGSQFNCYVLEDGYRREKVKHETRIPAGRYEIERRTVGKFYQNYRRRFKHISSLWIKDVPNYEYILIHIGNTVLDTSGCLLVGSDYKLTGNEYRIFGSTKTYRDLYSIISDHFKKGGRVFIDIERVDPEV